MVISVLYTISLPSDTPHSKKEIIMTRDELTTLINQLENAKLDFKRDWYSSEKKTELIKDMIALSNGNMHYLGQTAYLVIGVKECVGAENEIYGVELDKDIQIIKQELLQNLQNYTQPALQDFSIEAFSIDEKNIVVIEIPFHPYLIILKKTLRPPYLRDTLIYRTGEGTVVADYATRKAFEAAMDKHNAQANQQERVSITVQGDVKGVVNAERGSVINQTIS